MFASWSFGVHPHHKEFDGQFHKFFVYGHIGAQDGIISAGTLQPFPYKFQR